MSETEKTETKADPAAQLFAEQSQRTNDLLEQLLQERREPAKKAEAEQPRVWTQQELQAAVDAGNITTADMVNYLSEVKAWAAAKKVREEMQQELANERRRGSVEQKLAAYRASYPELNKRGTELRKQVDAAIDELVEEGFDRSDLRTELSAYRMALGEPGKKKEPVREQTGKRQVSVEAAGSSAEKGEKAKPAGGNSLIPSWVPDKNRDFYEKEIAKGRYHGKKGEEDLKKELDYLKRKIA